MKHATHFRPIVKAFETKGRERLFEMQTNLINIHIMLIGLQLVHFFLSCASPLTDKIPEAAEDPRTLVAAQVYCPASL